MPEYNFTSPGASAFDSLQSAMLQQQQLQRQAMLDELNKRNVESEISDREMNRKIQEERIQSERELRSAQAEERKAKAQQELKAHLPVLPIGAQLDPAKAKSITGLYEAAGEPSPIEEGKTLPSTQTTGGSPTIQAELPVEDPIAGAATRRDAVHMAIASGVPFDKVDKFINERFGATRVSKQAATPDVQVPPTYVGTESQQALNELSTELQSAKDPREVAVAILKAQANGAPQEKIKDISTAIFGSMTARAAAQPKVGSFEDYVQRSAGPNPTPQQIEEARKKWGEEGRAPVINMSTLVQPGGKEMLARAMAKGDAAALANLGWGSAGAQLKAEVVNIASHYNPQTDAFDANTPPDLSTNRVIRTAASATLKQQTEQLASVKTFTNTATKNLDLALEASNKVARTDSQFINKIVLNAVRGAEPAPDLTDFEVKIYTAVREYAKVAQAAGNITGGALTDTATKEATALLNSAKSEPAFKAAVKAMKADMNSILTSREATVKELREGLGEKSPAVVAPGGGGNPVYNPATGKVETSSGPSKNPTYNPATGKVE